MVPATPPVGLMLLFPVWDILTPDLLAVHFFPLLAVAAATGKAEGSASIVALVPLVAEKGKGVGVPEAGK